MVSQWFSPYLPSNTCHVGCYLSCDYSCSHFAVIRQKIIPEINKCYNVQTESERRGWGGSEHVVKYSSEIFSGNMVF